MTRTFEQMEAQIKERVEAMSTDQVKETVKVTALSEEMGAGTVMSIAMDVLDTRLSEDELAQFYTDLEEMI